MPIYEGYAHLLFIGSCSTSRTRATDHELTERRTWDRHALKFKHDIFGFKFKDRALR